MTTLCRELGGEKIGGGDLQSQCASHESLGKVVGNPGNSVSGCDVLGCAMLKVLGLGNLSSVWAYGIHTWDGLDPETVLEPWGSLSSLSDVATIVLVRYF